MTQRRIYQDECPYFITFNTAKGESVFEEEELARLLKQEIIISTKLKGYNVLAFQIMPNHIHLLIQKRTLESVRSKGDNNFPERIPIPERTFSKVRTPNSKVYDHRIHTYTISDLMQSIKGNFSYKHKLGNVWQPRFNSRIVNTEKYLATVVEYIQYNPTKDDLPKRYTNPPYRFIDMRKINEFF